MIVMKFGGTSVEDAPALRRVATIVRRELPRSPLVVVSACAGVTNSLAQLAEQARQRDIRGVLRTIREIRHRHEQIAHDLLKPPRAGKVVRHLETLAGELETLARGVAALGELTPRSQDAFLSFGERMSSPALQEYLLQTGIRSRLVSAREYMITDASHTKAVPIAGSVSRGLRKEVVPLLGSNRVVLTQGFIGATPDGIPTTLGRGGSDFSASYIGALLHAKEIQIWTDVDGILTADPTLVPGARNVPILTFREASELAYFGARVLHPDTIIPAVKRNIPVVVLNSRKPRWPGTRVVAHRPKKRNGAVQSIAYKEGVTLLNIVSTRMFLAHGFLERVFDVFHKYGTVVHTVATSDVSITAAVDDRSHLDALVRELRTFASVSLAERKAIICVVGEGLRHAPGTAARVLSAVGNVDINMISAGASEINISLAVAESSLPIAVRRLHAEFFPSVNLRRGEE
jgi:aspartate kinase